MKNRVWVVFLAALLVGCKIQPYSKKYIFTKQDDELGLQDKVDILKESSAVEDDALQASIANLYAQNGNWSAARTSMIKAIKLNPLEASYHLNLAHYYVELKTPELAYAEAKIAHELNAYDPNLNELLAEMAIETNDSIEGASFVNRYYSADTKNAKAQLLKARLNLFEGKFNEANRLVELGLQNDSTNELGWFTSFQVNKELNRFNAAVMSGKILIDLDSTNVAYYLQLARLFEKVGNNHEASNYYYRAYQLQPNLDLLKFVVNYHLEMKQYDSVLYYTDSLVAGSFRFDKNMVLKRARAFDKRYKYEDSYLLYSQLWENDTTDSVVVAERAIVQRKIAYLQRKKQEQKRLADSLANAMPTINF